MAEVEEIINEPSESSKRIQELSGKAKASEEAAKAAEEKAAEALKKAEFAEGFADVVASNPAAKDFKEDIRTKVMSGYSLEDATFAVLGKAGKLGTAAPAEPAPSPAGGSASTAITQQPLKTAAELSQEERRKILSEALDIT